MNNVIEFKKDCILKSMISEITDISLTHDYKVLDDMIDGYFDVTGEYKITPASLEREEFMFTIPFSIALSSLIDKDTINLKLKDFNYTAEKDVLHLKMSLDMEYQEIEIKEAIDEQPEETEEIEQIENIDGGIEDDSVSDILDSIESDILDEPVFHNELMNNMSEINNTNTFIKPEEINDIDIQDKTEAEESIKNIIGNMKDDSYYKYKIYIMRTEDTIESVAIKYNVTLDTLKEYNNIESINVGDKIVIPCPLTNEEN